MQQSFFVGGAPACNARMEFEYASVRKTGTISQSPAAFSDKLSPHAPVARTLELGPPDGRRRGTAFGTTYRKRS